MIIRGRSLNGKPWTLNAVSAAAYATQFSVTLSAGSGTTGLPVTATYAPVGGAWPSTTGTATTTLTGSFAGGGALAPAAGTTTPVTAILTPSADGTGSIGATLSGMTSTGSQTYTAVPAVVVNALTLASPGFVTKDTAKTFAGTFPTGATFSNLQYSLNNSTWQSLPGGAAASGTAFTFPLTFATLSNALQVWLRDSTNTGTVVTTGQFSCNTAPVYTTTAISGTVPSSIRLGLMAHGASLSSTYHTSAPGFAKGQFNPSTQRLMGQIGAGALFEIYCDQIKKWSDGSVRTCRVSVPITGTFADGVETVVNVTIVNATRASGHLTTPAALVAAHDWHVKHYGGQCGSDVFDVSLRDIVTSFSRDSWGTNPLGGWDVFADNPGELGIHGWRYWKRTDGASDAWRKTEIWVSQRIDGTFEVMAQVKQSNYDIPHPSATVNTGTQHSMCCFHELYQDTTLIAARGGPNDTVSPPITIPASNFNVSTNVVSGITATPYTVPIFFSASGGTLPSGVSPTTPYYIYNNNLYNSRQKISGKAGGDNTDTSITAFGSAGSGNIVVTQAYGTYYGSSLVLAAPNGHPYLIGATRPRVTVSWDEVYMSKWATLFPAYAQPSDTTFQMTRYPSSSVTDLNSFTSFTPNQPALSFWLNLSGDDPTGQYLGDPRIGYIACRTLPSLLLPHDATYDLTARVEGLSWGDYSYWWDDVSSGRVMNFGAATLANMGPPRPNSGFNYNGGDVSVGNGNGADASGYYDGYSSCMLTPSHMPAPWIVPYHHTGHPIYLDMAVHMAVTSGLFADGAQAHKTLNGVVYYGVIASSQDEQARGFAWAMRAWDYAEQFMPDSRPEAGYIKTQMDVSERFWRDYVDAFRVGNPAWFNLGLVIPDAHYSEPRFQPYMHAMAYMVIGQLAAHRERDYSNFLSAAGNLVVNLMDDAGPSPASVGTYAGYDAVGYYWAINNPPLANLQAMAALNAPYDNNNGGASIGSYPYPATGLPSSVNGPATYYTNGGYPFGTSGDYPMLFRCGLAVTAGLGVISYNGGQAKRAHDEWIARMTTAPCTGVKFSDVGHLGSHGDGGPHWFPVWSIQPVFYP